MVLELITFLGTSAGGNIAGHIGRWIQGKSEHADEKRRQSHELRLAEKGQLKEYMVALHGKTPDNTYSPMAWASCFLVLLLGVTYCACTISLFVENPSEIMYTKDPTADSRAFEIFFGFIKYDIANNKILSMSRAGVGFLMCYPIVFIISAVVTGEKPKRSR